MPTDAASYLPGSAPVVESKEGAEPAAAVPDEGKGSGASLPPELIQIPAIQGVLAGEPAAFSASIADFANRPEGKLIQKNAQSIMDAGLGLYRSLGGDIGVLFNRMYLADTEIQEADKAGTLAQIAPPFDEVNGMLGKAGQNHPALRKERQAPTGFKQGGAAAPNLTAGGTTQPNVPKSSQRTITSKTRNTLPGSPTSGPKPGSGRILNEILKPVV